MLRVFLFFCMKMAAPIAGKAGAAGPGSKPPFPELDFRSGARMEELNKLIQEFSKHDQREYDDQRALEIHTAKDFIFSMLGEGRGHPPSPAAAFFQSDILHGKGGACTLPCMHAPCPPSLPCMHACMHPPSPARPAPGTVPLPSPRCTLAPCPDTAPGAGMQSPCLDRT